MKEFDIYNQENLLSVIELKGEPYQKVVIGDDGSEDFVDCNVTLTNLANSSRYIEQLSDNVSDVEKHLDELIQGDGYYGIDRKIKKGEPLSFDDSFSLATFVCTSLNKPLRTELGSQINSLGSHETHLMQSAALLAALSSKEGYVGLTSDEVAGVVAATIKLDTVLRLPCEGSVLSFGGMGGDRGYLLGGDRSKLFSLSTLSSLALALDGLVHKHHSYPNTSKIAGQSAVEALGARSDIHTPEGYGAIMQESGIVMSSCHSTRTLHTLSHLLRGETVNHVIGPLAFTMSADTELQGFIGVNEKIHPETIIGALQHLDKMGFQSYGNSAAYCGTDLLCLHDGMLDEETYTRSNALKQHVVLDEIAPPPYMSLAAFLVNGKNAGTFEIHPRDFYDETDISKVCFDDLLIPNTSEDILFSNQQALYGVDESKVRYLAMTVGLGMFVRHDLGKTDALDNKSRRVNSSYLRERTNQAYMMIREGDVLLKALQYVKSTQRHAGFRIKET